MNIGRIARKSNLPIAVLIEKIMKDFKIPDLNELSKKTDIKYSTLHAILTKDRTPHLKTVQKLCETFDIDIDDYFQVKENEENTIQTERLISFFKRNINDATFKQIIYDIRKMSDSELNMFMKSVQVIAEKEAELLRITGKKS